MKRLMTSAFIVAGLLLLSVPHVNSQQNSREAINLDVNSQQANNGDILIPESSVEGPSDRGVRAHTNHQIKTVQPEGGLG